MPSINDLADDVFKSVEGYVGKWVAVFHTRLEELGAQLKAIPAGQEGKPGKDGGSGERGADGTNGKDGAPGADGLEGKPGRDGRDGLPGIPGVPGKDGADGLNGKDGLSLEDFELVLGADGRTLSMRLRNGATVVEKSVRLAIPQYRGIWREGEYQRGDTVTRGGSMFHCDRDTNTTPDSPGGSGDWTLATKRGTHGKDGKDGDRGPAGRDLTKS